MFEVNSPHWIEVVVASLYLLRASMKEVHLCHWLSPLHLGWIITGLLFIFPFIQKGSWLAMGVGYVLMGVLIVNTLILGFLSVLPNRLVSVKSKGIESMGFVIMSVLCTGLWLIVKRSLGVLVNFIKTQRGTQSTGVSLA